MSKREASRETLERLAEAVDEYNQKPDALAVDGTGARYERALAAYRAEIAPPLRTRAEVDAEIAGVIRDYHRHITRPGWKERPDWDSFSTGIKDDLNRLCAEPTAPGGETGPPCHQCGRPMAPMTSVLPGGAWLCHCRAETNQG